MGWEGLDWTDVAQVGDKWRARVNTVIVRTSGFHQVRGSA